MDVQKKQSKLLRFFSNPLVGFIGTTATIIALFLGVYFYLADKAKPELAFYPNPAKAIIYKSGQTSSLEILFNKEKILNDVTAVQMALWNNGKKAIERNDILEEIKILTEPETAILEAKVRKVSREVINLKIDNSQLDRGCIPVSWKILEQNDGGVIQLILKGGVDVKVLARGIIKGQNSIKGPSKQIGSGFKNNQFIFLFFGILSLIFYLVERRRKKEKREKIFYYDIFLVYLIGSFLIFLYLILFVKMVKPPFDF